MEIDEAVKELKEKRLLCVNSNEKPFAIAYDMSIKSLQAWYKVIEEIESQQKFDIECDGESDLGGAIQIIKKHLKEVEE